MGATALSDRVTGEGGRKMGEREGKGAGREREGRAGDLMGVDLHH